MIEKIGVVGAIGAAILASVCCIGPVVLAGLGIGAVTAAQQFAPLRPYFLALTVAFLGLGFYFAYRKPKQVAKCDGEVCETPKVARWGRPLLWLATLAVAALALFPSYGGKLVRATPASAPVTNSAIATVELKIDGMDCETCAAVIQRELMKTTGVTQAEVQYATGRASVKYDPAKSDPARLIEAIRTAGYKAEVSNSAQD